MNDLYARLDRLQRSGRAAVLCTVIRTQGSVPRHAGAKMLVFADGSIEGTVGGGELEQRVRQQASEVLQSKQATVVRHGLQDVQAGDAGVCGGTVEVFLEPLTQRATLLVIGGGHIGRALAHLGHWLGFHVVVSDDRPEHCSPTSVPEADEYRLVSVEKLAAEFPFTDDTWIVMPTRGIPLDVAGLPHLLEVPFGYLGVIGSQRRWTTVRKKLEQMGVPPEKLQRVHAPMGLELEAETPQEIALSIMAEILMLRNGGTGRSMQIPGSQPAEDSDTMRG